MNRSVDITLDAWRGDPRRRPLLLRGARQVGKSHTVTDFGDRAFAGTVVVNFEQEPRFRDCFATLDPRQILGALTVLTRQEIAPGRSLLFLDEIQECPRAVTALRYFHEQMPELHVISAGSLLDFALDAEDLRVPVGRIQYLYMYPLSFAEFLDALGEGHARQAVAGAGPREPLDPAVHEHLLSLIGKYTILGGMPAVVAEYVASGDFERCRRLQTAILQTFRDDFGKYANLARHGYLQRVFSQVPRMVANKFKYVRVDAEAQSRDLKSALELLERAGVVRRVYQTSGPHLPLDLGVRERHFKVLFLDVGLMQNVCGSHEELLLSEDVMQVNAGAVAEQLVGQELLACGDPYQPGSLFYWAREARSSSAEIDYLVPLGTRAVPIEVKAGKTGTLRSLRLYLDEYGAGAGIRVSTRPFDSEPSLLSVPLYALEHLPRLVKGHL